MEPLRPLACPGLQSRQLHADPGLAEGGGTLVADHASLRSTQALLPFHHYAFKVNDREFDEIFGRMKAENVKFSSNPNSVITDTYDKKINHNYGGRGVYFKDPNGHILEILTVDYDLDTDPATQILNRP